MLSTLFQSSMVRNWKSVNIDLPTEPQYIRMASCSLRHHVGTRAHKPAPSRKLGAAHRAQRCYLCSLGGWGPGLPEVPGSAR